MTCDSVACRAKIHGFQTFCMPFRDACTYVARHLSGEDFKFKAGCVAPVSLDKR